MRKKSLFFVLILLSILFLLLNFLLLKKYKSSEMITEEEYNDIVCTDVSDKEINDNRNIYMNFINSINKKCFYDEANLDENVEKDAAYANFNYYLNKYVFNNDLSEFYFGDKSININDIKIVNYHRVVSSLSDYTLCYYDFLYDIEYNGKTHFVFIGNSISDLIDDENLKYTQLHDFNRATRIYTDITSSRCVLEYMKHNYSLNDNVSIVNTDFKSCEYDTQFHDEYDVIVLGETKYKVIFKHSGIVNEMFARELCEDMKVVELDN